MPNRNFMPSRDADLLLWAGGFVNEAALLQSQMGWPAARITEIQDEVVNFTAAMENLKNGRRSPILTNEKNTVRDRLIRLVRDFVAEFIHGHPAVTDAMRLALGVTVPSPPPPTAHPVPTTVPQVVINTDTPRCVIISWKDEGSTRRARPFGVAGMEIAWRRENRDWDGPFPNVDALLNHDFDTRPRFTMEFQETDRGCPLIFVVRWRNTRAEHGHWSPFYKCFIP